MQALLEAGSPMLANHGTDIQRSLDQESGFSNKRCRKAGCSSDAIDQWVVIFEDSFAGDVEPFFEDGAVDAAEIDLHL